MEQTLDRKEKRKEKESKPKHETGRFQPPRPDMDEDPGKDVWYMGF